MGETHREYWKPLFFKTSSFNFYCRKLPVSFCLVSLALWLLCFHGSKRPSWNSSEPGAAHGSLNASIQSAISPVNLEMKNNVAQKTQTSRNGHPKTTTYNNILVFNTLKLWEFKVEVHRFVLYAKHWNHNFSLQKFRGVEHRSAALCLGDQSGQTFFSSRPTSPQGTWHDIADLISYIFWRDIMIWYTEQIWTNGPKSCTLKTLSLNTHVKPGRLEFHLPNISKNPASCWMRHRDWRHQQFSQEDTPKSYYIIFQWGCLPHPTSKSSF